MKATDRRALREITAADPGIDVVIVHHADGSNDFFSAKPEVEQCERHRVIEICLDIAVTLEGMTGRPASCPGSSRKGPGCPV